MPKRIGENISFASTLELSGKDKVIEYISFNDFTILKKLGNFILTSTTGSF